jgi:hypothetical protein
LFNGAEIVTETPVKFVGCSGDDNEMAPFSFVTVLLEICTDGDSVVVVVVGSVGDGERNGDAEGDANEGEEVCELVDVDST